MAGLTVEQDLRVRSALADLHERCFKRDMKVTLVARHPTEAERHLVCGDDDLAAVAELVASKVEGPQRCVITIADGDGVLDIRTEFVPAIRQDTPASAAVSMAMDIHQFIADRIAGNAEEQIKGQPYYGEGCHPDGYQGPCACDECRSYAD